MLCIVFVLPINNHIDRLERIQRKIENVTLISPNYTERLADCNLMKLENVFDFQRLVFGFKLLNGFLPNSFSSLIHKSSLRGYSTPWTLFLKTLCIFSQNKATLDKLSYWSGQKCFKELQNLSFTSVETMVVKLQQNFGQSQYFACFEP